MDGTRDSGSMQVAATGPETWRVANLVTSGVDILFNDVWPFGHVNDRDTGITTYLVAPDSQIAGRWSTGVNGSVGFERLLPR